MEEAARTHLTTSGHTELGSSPVEETVESLKTRNAKLEKELRKLHAIEERQRKDLSILSNKLMRLMGNQAHADEIHQRENSVANTASQRPHSPSDAPAVGSGSELEHRDFSTVISELFQAQAKVERDQLRVWTLLLELKSLELSRGDIDHNSNSVPAVLLSPSNSSSSVPVGEATRTGVDLLTALRRLNDFVGGQMVARRLDQSGEGFSDPQITVVALQNKVKELEKQVRKEQANAIELKMSLRRMTGESKSRSGSLLAAIATGGDNESKTPQQASAQQQTAAATSHPEAATEDLARSQRRGLSFASHRGVQHQQQHQQPSQSQGHSE